MLRKRLAQLSFDYYNNNVDRGIIKIVIKEGKDNDGKRVHGEN